MELTHFFFLRFTDFKNNNEIPLLFQLMFPFLTCVWYQVLLTSKDWPFLIVPSVFSNFYGSYSCNLMIVADSMMCRIFYNSTLKRRDLRGLDRMEVRFITTYAISVYHQ